MPRAGYILPAFRFPMVYPKDINRLITSLSPTGKVVFQDDFEAEVLKWDAVISGTGTIARNTTHAFDGGASLKITTSAGENDYTEAVRFVGLDFYKKSPLGLEAWWCAATMADGQDMQMGFEWGDGVKIYSAYLRYERGTGWQVKDRTNWRTFSTTPIIRHGSYYEYNYIKLIADLVKERYIKAIINGVEFDISMYTTHAWYANRPTVEFFVWNRNNGIASTQEHYWDNIIATCEE